MYIPGLWVWSRVRVHLEGIQWMLRSLSPFLSLSKDKIKSNQYNHILGWGLTKLKYRFKQNISCFQRVCVWKIMGKHLNKLVFPAGPVPGDYLYFNPLMSYVINWLALVNNNNSWDEALRAIPWFTVSLSKFCQDYCTLHRSNPINPTLSMKGTWSKATGKTWETCLWMGNMSLWF